MSKRGCFPIFVLVILILGASIFMIPYYQYYPEDVIVIDLAGSGESEK